MIKTTHKLLTLALLLFTPLASNAGEWVSSFGMGYKIPGRYSAVLDPMCKQVHLFGEHQLSPSSPNWGKGLSSCGGDNPAFIGWPIAWQSDDKGKYGAYTVRMGWFHMSHWFDGGNYVQGGDDHEIFVDMLALTTTFSWSKWRKGRRRNK